MSNTMSMSADFERQKNTQATIYTAMVAAALLLLFIWVRWSAPVENPPVTEEVVDINLGSGDQGSGTDQPRLPGDPAPAQQTSYVSPTPSHAAEESVKDVSSDENEKESPPVIKPAVSKPEATRINEESKVTKTKVTTTPQPVINPAPPRPKALMGKVMGGNGNGGNGADAYKPGGNEGIAGGNGDQGRPGGNPNGKSYTGAPKNFGVKVFSVPNQSFEDDFNENAKVAMDIVVDGNGHITSATFQPRGSTTSDRHYIEIAERSARQLKWPPSDGGQRGTVIFNFKVRG